MPRAALSYEGRASLIDFIQTLNDADVIWLAAWVHLEKISRGYPAPEAEDVEANIGTAV